ncbi:HPP family protein [Zavarzinia compransoris]|uniref:HPP family protein n=2 Tax=Zavarzinia compransoris TaxID=1264899 RepID=A0A317E5Z9_9PROT|nr:HPP family protein [Zavarzinia compransoris]
MLTTLVTHLWREKLGVGPAALPLLVAPMGASAVLLFAVPASPLAQPWSIVGGNVLSALAGIACRLLIGDPTYAGAVAVAAAIAVMSLARCLHPPGGASALTAVIGGPEIAAAGWSFALLPVGLNALVLLAVGWAFNNLTKHWYPHRAPPLAPNPHETADPPPQDRVGVTPADLDAVLARYDELLDVSRDDLASLFAQVELQAERRLHGAIRCARIMSRDVIRAGPEEGVGQARDRLLARRLAAMPVIAADGGILGLVGHAELLAGAGRRVGEVMRREIVVVAPDAPIVDLLPVLSGGVHHEVLVAGADGRLAGMITQTDLIAALWRGHVAEQAARAI